jgi:hypothetical protein
MSVRTSIVTLLLVFLSACGAGDDNKGASPAAPLVETATVSNGADLLEAFHEAFGQAAPYRATIPTSEGSLEHRLDFSPLAFINIAPDVVALVSRGEGRDTDYSCHACAGAMTMHYLKRGPQGFTVLGRWQIASGGAAYGAVNPLSVRTDLDDVPTMIVADTSGGMGCEVETDTLVALTPTGPEDRGSFTRLSSYQELVDVKNGPKDYSYAGKVIPLDKGKQFTVEYSGGAPRSIKFDKQSDRIYRSGQDFPPAC